MEPAGLPRVERRLAAILAADVAGYRGRRGRDSPPAEGAPRRGDRPKIAGHHGRIVKTTGDGLLVEFASVVDALRCAAGVQAAIADDNAPLPPDRRIEFRLGIHQGDIVVENDDIFSDGVNIAARLEGLAEPGGICISARVQEDRDDRADPQIVAMVAFCVRKLQSQLRVHRGSRKGTGSRHRPARGACCHGRLRA
jgi:adenylate cyclase